MVEEWIGRDLRSKDIIDELRRWFMRMGAPNRLRSDGGPQFTSSEIREFLDEWGVLHVFSSPHFPQSNGHAEAAVKAMKTLLIKTAPKKNQRFGFFRSRSTGVAKYTKSRWFVSKRDIIWTQYSFTHSGLSFQFC